MYVTGELVRTLVDLLGEGRAGLITDVDGTISPIVELPEEALVLPLARQALARLREQIHTVAVVSGRAVADAKKMVGLDGIVYVGNHGLELWGPNGPEVPQEARPWVPRVAAVVKDIEQHVQIPGVVIENKGPTASIHYRLTDDPAQARRQLLEVIATCTLTSGLRLEEGRMVLNLLPPLTVSKGSAVAWLAKEQHLNRLVYLGDDVTDTHAFKALTVLRSTGTVKTLSIGVVGSETPPTVKQLADASVPSVHAVAELLWDVSEALNPGGTMNEESTLGAETHAWRAIRTRAPLSRFTRGTSGN